MSVFIGYSPLTNNSQPYNRHNLWSDTLVPKYHWTSQGWIQSKRPLSMLLWKAWSLLPPNSWNITLPVDFLSLNGQVISKLPASNVSSKEWAAVVTDPDCGLLWKRGIGLTRWEHICWYWVAGKYLCRNVMECGRQRGENSGWYSWTNNHDTSMITQICWKSCAWTGIYMNYKI